MSEVVSNACKYGSAPDGSVTVEVSLKKVGKDRGVLVIKDNGPGFEPGAVRRGMGSSLIKVFAASISSFAYASEDGTRFMLTIKRQAPSR